MVASAAVVGLGYIATPVAPVVDYLYAGQPFATDEIDAITRALAAKHIKPHVDDMGRIGVASDQVDEATDVVAKLDVGPRSIPEMREWANQSSLLGPADGDRAASDRGARRSSRTSSATSTASSGPT